MGNTQSAAVQQRLIRFRPEDRTLVEGVYDRVLDPPGGTGGPSGGGLTLETLQSSMGGLVPAPLVRRLYRCMLGIDAGKPSSAVSRDQLIVFLADTLRGTAEERAPLVLSMSRSGSGSWSGSPSGSQSGSQVPGPADVVSCEQVVEFLEDLIRAVVQVLVQGGRLGAWRPDKMADGGVGVRLLAEVLTSDLRPSGPGCDRSCLETWIFRTPQVSSYLDLVVSEGLQVPLGAPDQDLLPPCRETPWGDLKVLMLDLPTLMFLAAQVPDGTRVPWSLVFSTQLHGESFTRFLSSLTKWAGPTLLLIRDSRGHMFGGYASHSWRVKPQFQGDSRCFLFSVLPSLRVFSSTGYNQNYMYLNQNQQTLPNGLGMGGQLGYFGLWLDSDFGRGHSRARPRCTTYGSPQLSRDQDFILDSLEVWALGTPPEPDQDEDASSKRSVLDADLEVKAMMEMTGKTLHSQGLREPEED